MVYENSPFKKGWLPIAPEINKILYATDLSEISSTALSWTLTLAHRFDAKVVLFHTSENISQMGDIGIGSQLGDQRWQEVKEKIERDAVNLMKKRLDQVCNEASNEVSASPLLVEEIVVKRGYPADKILCEAEDRNCDLVVMGTRRAGKLHKALMRSTTRRFLRRSKTPVFVIPLSAEN